MLKFFSFVIIALVAAAFGFVMGQLLPSPYSILMSIVGGGVIGFFGINLLNQHQ
jgi:lipopolysaccharide export LptBFGC system permease protein LptF